MQKLYCYVDESGQDPKSEFFVVLERKIAAGKVYATHYKKPIPYFFPMVEILERAIKEVVRGRYLARIYIDGIDKQKSQALTNALRASGISLRMVRSRRDESEPLIRLADMWAGCLRSALLKNKDAQAMVRRAQKEKYLRIFTT